MNSPDSRKWRDDDPRRLRMAEKRADILRAAGPIMLRDGLGGTTLDRVASEGGIAKMTLYRHFPSKEALFEGLIHAMCDAMREGIEHMPLADMQQSAAARLAHELRAFTIVVITPDALALYRLIVAESWRFPGLGRTFEQSGMRVIRQRIAGLLEAGGVSAEAAGRRAAEVVALALGDAYEHALLGIQQEDDGAVWREQIDAAVQHAFGHGKDC